MRKLLSVILALVMVLGVFTPVFAEEAPKATEAPEAAPIAAPTMEKHIEFLQEQGIIKGDKTGNLMLDQNIDRASFAAILVRAAGKEATAESVKTLAPRFKDLTVAHWANGYATVALESNLMKGNPAGEFMPGKQISYAEIATTLVRFLNKEKAGFVYPTSYIAAASELGLFNGVEIGGAYASNATRNNVFKMLYNAVSKEDFGKYNVYKMIVLENSRVAQLAKDEVKAEILSVVQIANNVSERNKVAKVGQQMVFNIKDVKVEGGLADTENLIGKVVDVTIDENNKLVKAVVDNKNYQYYADGFKASKDGKTLKISNRLFNVRFDERYFDWAQGEFPRTRQSDRDDRVYRTYVTSGLRAQNYNYIRFAERINLPKDNKDKINANFARVTVKDGMVLFVDAYNYTDIAPVKEVAREGEDVYYYNDARNATVERMTPARRVIGFTAKDGFKNIDKKDIKKDDVIHWMDGFTLVRQDAPLSGKLEKTFENADGEFALIKEAEDKTNPYYLNSKKYSETSLQSVFAYDDQHFNTLDSRQQINKMVGSDVKTLLDVFGDIQLITSHEKFTDRLGLIDRVVSSKGMQFFAPNAPEESLYRLNDGWDSNYYRSNYWNAAVQGLKVFGQTRVPMATSQEAKYAEFSRLDLVYTTSDKDGNAGIVATIDGFEYDGDKYNKYPWEFASFIDARRDFIKVGTDNVRYDDQTDVFVINKAYDINDNLVRNDVIQKVTMADVKKYNKDNTNLKAAVLTEKDYAAFLGKIKVETWGRYNQPRDDFAKAIVFTNYKGPQADFERAEIGKIVRIDNWSNKVEIEVTRGNTVEFVIHPASRVNMKNIGAVGQFVEFRRVKDADPMKARFDYIINATDEGDVTGRTAYTITVNGQTYKTDNNTKEFGDSRYNHAWVYVVGGYADLIVFTKPGEAPAIVVTPQDRIDYNTFRSFLAIAKSLAANQSATEQQKQLAVQGATQKYNDLKAGGKSLVSAKEKEELESLQLLYSLGSALQSDYEKAYKALKEIKKVENDAQMKDAKVKVAVVEQYVDPTTGIAKLAGLDVQTGPEEARRVKALIAAYVSNTKAERDADAQKRVDAYRDSEARRIENEFARVMNNYTEAQNTAAATEVEAVKTAINTLKTTAIAVVDASKEAEAKAKVDVEIQKIKVLIAEYEAKAKAN